ncbi:hypothetical protein [Haloarcula montana]|uniref:hypothetical protein n=1 Tax=Haloarcula montana TaxID=3111776 RepID=UPI002D77BCB8|nr:hypothetical protein [Haloarcula sp. GH36]
MVPPTRRRFLHGAAGIAAALAGCSGLTGGSASSTATAGERDDTPPDSGRATDPDSVVLRTNSERPPIWLTDPNGDGERPDPDDRRLHIASTLVDSPGRADRVAVADIDGKERVTAFLDATDFASETLYLETNRVEECFELTLCSVSWSPDDIETDYARTIRPYNEACAVENRVFEARLIRIPAALDEGEVHSHGSSIGSGTCNRGPGMAAERSGDESDAGTAESGDGEATTVAESGSGATESTSGGDA